jgi:hypothetical protein
VCVCVCVCEDDIASYAPQLLLGGDLLRKTELRSVDQLIPHRQIWQENVCECHTRIIPPLRKWRITRIER